MTETTFTFRVDRALKNEFSKAAKAHDRAGSQLIRDFMRDFVKRGSEAADYDAWFRRQVQIGLDDAEAGRLVPDDVVKAEFAKLRAETKRRLKKRA